MGGTTYRSTDRAEKQRNSAALTAFVNAWASGRSQRLACGYVVLAPPAGAARNPTYGPNASVLGLTADRLRRATVRQGCLNPPLGRHDRYAVPSCRRASSYHHPSCHDRVPSSSSRARGSRIFAFANCRGSHKAAWRRRRLS